MQAADPATYLASLGVEMKKHWPENRTVTVVCHGHSVPAGYMATPFVSTFDAYPHLLHRALKDRFPFAVINVIVTAIGGETAVAGRDRFESDVLNHRPDVVTIDYGLNDRGGVLEASRSAWSGMIEAAIDSEVRVVLLTPTGDVTIDPGYSGDDARLLEAHASQIRDLAREYRVGIADPYSAFADAAARGELGDLLSWANHPNRAGHEIVARELLRWFPVA